MMELNKSTRVSIRIILLFVTAILLSLLPDYFREFFGDTLCNGISADLNTHKEEYFFHYGGTHRDLLYHWGYRHWLFLLMGISLAAVQVANIVSIIGKED